MHQEIPSEILKHILQLTKASQVFEVELLQPLWNHYGTLSRVHLRGGERASVVVKYIKSPERYTHPQGFASTLSRQRKLRSYQIETYWYQNYNNRVTSRCLTPTCLDVMEIDEDRVLILEDLSTIGFGSVITSPSLDNVKTVLSWLAHFHALFLHDQGDGLWERGTYWYLATRPEELEKIKGERLYHFSSLIDARLNSAHFQTLLHGDAKLANFCFKPDLSGVAGVDFQYVGRGVGIKDVAYLLGSCLSSTECEHHHEELLTWYFYELNAALVPTVNSTLLEAEWRALYPVACADFQRFMSGWNPHHRKLTHYSDQQTERGLHTIIEELMKQATDAAIAAGTYIQSRRHQSYRIFSKGKESQASDVLTEIDLHAQEIILTHLASSVERYYLGILAEEGEADQSRLRCHAFWAIDPLDGTRYFVEGGSGYAVSIALVSRSGESLLGVIYDPVNEQLYQSVKGQGVRLNGAPSPHKREGDSSPTKITWYADRSLSAHPHFKILENRFNIIFSGGAVMNTIRVLSEPKSCYCKAPKDVIGGCAIWDLAAATLMLEEGGGSTHSFEGGSLNLNRAESIFFNDLGLVFTSPDLTYEELMNELNAMDIL